MTTTGSARPAVPGSVDTPPRGLRLSRRVAAGLMAFGVWSWIIWLTFLKNIWADDRSWSDGATPFFLVHLVLIVVSIAFGTAIGALGVRAWRAAGR